MVLARAVAAVLVAAALAGCHPRLAGGVRCPGRGGPAWREYRSRHFVLDTDLERGAAAALLGDLEHLQALASVALAGEARELPGYVRVVVPARDETYRAVASRVTLGFYTSSVLGEPMVVLHASALRRDPQLVAHELAHHVAGHLFPRQPRWFAEGLAQFAQTVASEVPGAGRAAGRVPSGAAPHLRDLPALPASRLLAWQGGGEGGRPPGEYQAWSWVLYHWLWSERPEQLAEYQARLARAEEPGQAWRAAFPGLDPDRPGALDALDAALDAHRRSAALRSREVRAGSDPTFTVAPLSPADVHLLLLDVRRSQGLLAGAHRREGSHREVAAAEVEAALDDDPANPVARAASARLRGGDPVAALREAAAARPGDWRVWLLLGDALGVEGDAAEREAAYRAAVSLNADSAPAHAGLASLLAARGRGEEALPVARRAVALAPGSPWALATLAWIAAALGRCEDARATARRAADVAGGGPDADAIRRRARDAEARCGGR